MHVVFSTQALQDSIADGHILSEVLSGRQNPVYCPNQAALRQAVQRDLGRQGSARGFWDWCPEEAGSLLIEAITPLPQPNALPSEEPGEGTAEPSGAVVPKDLRFESGTPVPLGILIMFGSPAAPPSQRDRLWARALAGKLYLTLTARESPAGVATAPQVSS